MIEAENLSEEMMDEMVEAFDNVEVCDSTCLNLFIKSIWSLHKSVEWAKRDEVYVKRAAFVIMAGLAMKDKKAKNLVFGVFSSIMIRESGDERAEIKDAISWALIEMGKRNSTLHKKAIKTAKKMLELDVKTAHEVGEEVLKALETPTLINT